MGKDLRQLNKLIRDYENKEDKGAGDLMTLVYKAYLMGLNDSGTCPEAKDSIQTFDDAE